MQPHDMKERPSKAITHDYSANCAEITRFAQCSCLRDIFSSRIIAFKSPSTPARIFRVLCGKRRCHAFGPNVYLASPRVSGRQNILLTYSRRDCKAPSPALGGRSASRDLRGLQVRAINSNPRRLRVHVLCRTHHPNFAR